MYQLSVLLCLKNICANEGFNVDDEVFELINDEYANLNPVGLHAHIGSQIFETSVYYDEVKIILEQIRHIKDKFNIYLFFLTIQ